MRTPKPFFRSNLNCWYLKLGKSLSGYRRMRMRRRDSTTKSWRAASRSQANLERASQAARQAAAAQGGGGGGGESEELWRGGKPRYFAGGGPVGPDRIPAFLSRGESVNTAGATSKFFSQISAMNAGHSPTAATAVGDTNVSFGDINVSGASTNNGTADAVVNGVRRALRRGSSRPF